VVANTMVRESVEALAKRAVDEFGKVHIVCNNAGIAAMAGGIKPIWEVSDRDWQWVMGVNFYGVLYGIQAFVPGMLAHGEEGHIVNTASLAGVMPGGGTYGVSKHGVLSLTETLHQNFTMMGAKIGASVLCPGFVNTNIFDAERNRPKDLATAPGAAIPGMAEVARNMLAAGKQPADVADIVFKSIQENRFYILPHPAWDPIVRARVDAILARGAPMSLDMEDMMKRRAAGEQF
jgi:NAD(P)-dependent dehydrogenase (short-subunit alcohol dehydrogenase family)